MDQDDRILIQQQFQQGHLDWICATNAFGMGIHKDNIRQIIHDHIPTSDCQLYARGWTGR